MARAMFRALVEAVAIIALMSVILVAAALHPGPVREAVSPDVRLAEAR